MPDPKLPEPKPESHWYASDLASQPPRDMVLSVQRLVQEARGRLGPSADLDTVLEDLRSRSLDVTRSDVVQVWEDLA